MEQVETKVDVLAVMDALVESSARVAAGGTVTADPHTVEVAKRTRAAIAELIEAANRAHMALIGYLPAHRNAVTDEAIAKVSAALARVGGGK